MAVIRFLKKDFELPYFKQFLDQFEGVYGCAQEESDKWAKACGRLAVELRKRGLSPEEIARIGGIPAPGKGWLS